MSGATRRGAGSFKDLRPDGGGEAEDPTADGTEAPEPSSAAEGPGDVPATVAEPVATVAPDLGVVADESDELAADQDGPDDADRGLGPDSLEAERDDYIDRLQRLQAEFENYRKRMTREQTDLIARAAERLAEELLPVLDACDAAVLQGADDIVPIQTQLVDILVKQGLEPLAAEGDPFDPDRHEAVMHEPHEDDDGDGDGDGTVVEVLRAGYGWKGRVLRPAMVKVRG